MESVVATMIGVDHVGQDVDQHDATGRSTPMTVRRRARIRARLNRQSVEPRTRRATVVQPTRAIKATMR